MLNAPLSLFRFLRKIGIFDIFRSFDLNGLLWFEVFLLWWPSLRRMVLRCLPIGPPRIQAPLLDGWRVLVAAPRWPPLLRCRPRCLRTHLDIFLYPLVSHSGPESWPEYPGPIKIRI